MDKQSQIAEYQKKISLSNRAIDDANAQINKTKSNLKDKESAMNELKQILSEIELHADRRKVKASRYPIIFPNTRFMAMLQDNLNLTSTNETVKLSNSINQDIYEIKIDILKDYNSIDLYLQKISMERSKIQHYRREISKLRSIL